MNTFRPIDGFSASIAKKIGRMLEGEALASSVLPQWMADELKQEGLLGVTANGSRKVYRIIDADLIWQSK